uniref:t-SNARE coiled-coil homology domain-containing protein n=1 Tax=Acrobeloides nanus TaxID=290746 RepID=A0A914DRH9_9BILA
MKEYSKSIKEHLKEVTQSVKSSFQALSDEYSKTNYSSVPINFSGSAIESSFQAITDQYNQEPQASDSFEPVSAQFVIAYQFEMPQRDRTTEFKTIGKSYQMKIVANGDVKNRDDREKIIRSSVQFNQLARRIGRDLSMTCAKMEKLTELAKKKSLFDDRTGEVEELSGIIKQDITGLNNQIASLQEMVKQRLSSSNKEHGNHTKLVVVGLQSKLANVGKVFQSVLENRTKVLKEKKNRREIFSNNQIVQPSLPPSASNGRIGSLLVQDDQMASGSSSVALDMGALEDHRTQQQVSLIDDSQSYYQSRYTAMETIESSISELGQIFSQLASLVSEQGEMITRIDSNVEETAMNVEAAHHELLKYFNNISKNRWLIIKIFGVLMAFFVFFVIFMT